MKKNMNCCVQVAKSHLVKGEASRRSALPSVQQAHESATWMGISGLIVVCQAEIRYDPSMKFQTHTKLVRLFLSVAVGSPIKFVFKSF